MAKELELSDAQKKKLFNVAEATLKEFAKQQKTIRQEAWKMIDAKAKGNSTQTIVQKLQLANDMAAIDLSANVAINDRVHRAADNDADFRTRAARGSGATDC
ncbi:MAG: hypothetical protein GY904_19955 [Planctomycetaceae bacterium]|nr:hypothetical protein [Planctomycetaceae bacterium]